MALSVIIYADGERLDEHFALPDFWTYASRCSSYSVWHVSTLQLGRSQGCLSGFAHFSAASDYKKKSGKSKTPAHDRAPVLQRLSLQRYLRHTSCPKTRTSKGVGIKSNRSRHSFRACPRSCGGEIVVNVSILLRFLGASRNRYGPPSCRHPSEGVDDPRTSSPWHRRLKVGGSAPSCIS